jgi:hypothetical protein
MPMLPKRAIPTAAPSSAAVSEMPDATPARSRGVAQVRGEREHGRYGEGGDAKGERDGRGRRLLIHPREHTEGDGGGHEPGCHHEARPKPSREQWGQHPRGRKPIPDGTIQAPALSGE